MKWNFNCFAQQLREFTEYSESLVLLHQQRLAGHPVVCEHRITIGESLQAKTFIVPDNFHGTVTA